MKVWKTNKKNEVVRILDGRSNSYFISTASGNILVDTGTQNDQNRLLRHLRKLHLARELIDYLILTHTHFDHCQNAAFVKNKWNASIYAGHAEMEYPEKGFTPLPRGIFSFTKFLIGIVDRLNVNYFKYEPFTVDVPVDKDAILMKDEDIKVEIILTPGHSPGSVSLIIDNDIAIVGDAMIGIFENSIIPPFADDAGNMVKSWTKLLNTGCRWFLPGHGHEITRPMIEKAIRKYAPKFGIGQPVTA